MPRPRSFGLRHSVGRVLLIGAVVASGGCGHSRTVSGAQALAAPKHGPPLPLPGPPPAPLDGEATPIWNAQLDGRAFPDHVLALTWDDGPDKHTLELARYLSSRHVSGTFFVVQSWRAGLSSAPGSGSTVFETGYAHLPVLQELVKLGQRIANHTLNHVKLPSVAPQLASRELAENQRNIDPFLSDEARFFRAPAGAWDTAIARRTTADAYLGKLVGPIRWDIDRKDWENSVECASKTPARDCESWHDGLRLKPQVTARRYLETIEHMGHGIVLMHDRVGAVGSHYALDVAHSLLPVLIARGYVFAAPVLAFSPPVGRVAAAVQDALRGLSLQGLKLVDENGDGRADLCGLSANQTYCLPSEESPGAAGGQTPKAFFATPEPVVSGSAALTGAFPGQLPPGWDTPSGAALSGDLDGDGLLDLCRFESGGLMCARGEAHGYDAPRRWLASAELALGSASAPDAAALADVNGDRHADACWVSSGEVRCSLWKNGAFAAPSRWFEGSAKLPLFGDLNGDHRADLCFQAPHGIACAFSTGATFTGATTWVGASSFPDDSQLVLADINGDGRADLCGLSGGQVACGLAP
ncbi:MAG: polysaccharide deacetylase family protein [Polyangiaceae bacterium]